MPSQWRLDPAGKQMDVGSFPVNLAFHTSGKWLAVLHAGYGEHEIMIIDSASHARVSRVSLDCAFYGMTFTPDGTRLIASGGDRNQIHLFDFENGYLSHHQTINGLASGQDFVLPAGMACDPAGQTLFVAGCWANCVFRIPLSHPESKDRVTLEPGDFPYACVFDTRRSCLYVSLWGHAGIAVIDAKTLKIIDRWQTDGHPTEMALHPAGNLLFVACANSPNIDVLDLASGKVKERLNCSLNPTAAAGNTAASLCLSADGALLLAANADTNNVAVFNVSNPGHSSALGFIPVGWYPTCVRQAPKDKRVYVANGRGSTPKANSQGPIPSAGPNATVRQYIGDLYTGTLSIVDQPTPESMVRYTRQAAACSPQAQSSQTSSPIPKRPGDPSLVKHIVYIIKENRTYDQVFGDIKAANGDPALCLFPERVTPNHHRLARDFVLLDNFYVDGEVSASGHEWSTAAYATDFVEKLWPLGYRRHDHDGLPYVGNGAFDPIARPAGGYLWDACAAAKLSYRSYGEFIDNGKKPGDPPTTNVPALVGHFDTGYRAFDMDYPDQGRADRFIDELARFEREGEMPSFIIMHLPGDHTSGTRPGKRTPIACVADNDLALGRIIEALTKSPFWKNMAVFVVEDDAQSGPDHVDAHRTVALAISPYARRHAIDSNLYSTSSMVRTMELLLGLQPLSVFDAAALPMHESFQSTPDLTGYLHVIPAVDLKEKNGAASWGAAQSARMDFTKPDVADEQLLNAAIWHSVRGPASTPPPPTRAAFFYPRRGSPLAPERQDRAGDADDD
jgi:DNA-binding beta-propeller fold protein YncE